MAKIHSYQKLRDALNALGADKQRMLGAFCTVRHASL
jgi:hypothetical protein